MTRFEQTTTGKCSESGAKTYRKFYRIAQEELKRLYSFDASLKTERACPVSILELMDKLVTRVFVLRLFYLPKIVRSLIPNFR